MTGRKNVTQLVGCTVLAAIGVFVAYKCLPKHGDGVPAAPGVLKSELRRFRETTGDYPRTVRDLVHGPAFRELSSVGQYCPVKSHWI